MANVLQILLLIALGGMGRADAGDAQITGRVTDDDGEGVAAVVYLDLPSGERTSRPKAAIVNQKNKAFTPSVLAVEVGQEVRFPNSDPVFHNAFSVTKENSFDLGLFKSPATKSVHFKKSGLVSVFCNIHPKMSATIAVLNHRYHARSDEDGGFTLSVPKPGTYVVKAVDEFGNTASTKLQLPSSAPVRIVFEDREAVTPAHLNKHGKPYPPLPREY